MRTPRPSPASSPSPFMPFDAAADVPRQQMAVAAESACAMFRGFEAMRKIQERAAHEALARHAVAAEKLGKPCTAAQLLAIETDLLRFDFEGATRYWQELTAAAIEMQSEMAGCCTHLVDSDAVLEATGALGH